MIHSGAFRFALALAFVFAAGSAMLLWTVERQVAGYAAAASAALLKNEAAVLAGEYRTLGLSGLTDALARRGGVRGEAQYRYLLLDSHDARLFGSLPASTARLGWARAGDREPDGSLQPLKTLGVRLPNGLLLVVATDAFDIEDMHQRLIAFTLASGVAITLFALVGGYLAGRLFLQRLGRVNAAVERIIDGDRKERLPEIGVAPEFDDLTRNLNRMLDRKAAAMEAVRQVSTAIAHDLRTPLTRLRNRLDEARINNDGPSRAVLDDVLEQTDAILITFHALLRIGMIESGVGRQRFAPVDLGELLGRIHQLYQPAAEDAAHVFNAVVRPGFAVMGDAELLAQLFTNLVENALVHTPAGSWVEARIDEEEGRILVSVRDDGPSVNAADLAGIFKRFYRGDPSRNSPGSGLGLSLVAAIADLHDATYVATRLEPGLAVTISFPGAGAA